MTKFGQKFCNKHPLKQEGEIVDFEPQTMGGTIGGLDLIGGGAIKGLAKIVKPFLNTAKQYAQKAGWLKKSSNFKPLVTGNTVHDTQSVNNAFASRFGNSSPKNVISNATVDRASQMRNISRGNIGNPPRWAKPPKKKS
tara:strand:- start:219 stop:635 length:417 start_codon:yes stop_codon:yes gene_type:complete